MPQEEAVTEAAAVAATSKLYSNKSYLELELELELELDLDLADCHTERLPCRELRLGIGSHRIVSDRSQCKEEISLPPPQRQSRAAAAAHAKCSATRKQSLRLVPRPPRDSCPCQPIISNTIDIDINIGISISIRGSQRSSNRNSNGYCYQQSRRILFVGIASGIWNLEVELEFELEQRNRANGVEGLVQDASVVATSPMHRVSRWELRLWLRLRLRLRLELDEMLSDALAAWRKLFVALRHRVADARRSDNHLGWQRHHQQQQLKYSLLDISTVVHLSAIAPVALVLADDVEVVKAIAGGPDDDLALALSEHENELDQMAQESEQEQQQQQAQQQMQMQVQQQQQHQQQQQQQPPPQSVLVPKGQVDYQHNMAPSPPSWVSHCPI
ncbi:GL15226 [Drosophila persimilis]|uniref:GL15226 n=1 Tax=Drosophila persimilis TaxID=7234 RepID=B4H3R9_DROPE|nr:GL15226 [Drosophila persimilis]